MRKIWITCGWVMYGAGVFLAVTMGLAWLGGGKPIKMIPSIVGGCLFILLGRSFVAKGRSFPAYAASKDSEAARNDQLAARRMIIQAIWIGSIILLTVALAVGLLIFFTFP
jgi:fatty acid desaturase